MPDSRKKKLQMLTQSLLRGDIAAAKRALELPGSTAGQPPHADAPQPQPPDAGPLELVGACPGCEIETPSPRGPIRHWLIRRTLAEIGPDHGHISSQYVSVLRGAGQRLDELDASVGLCHAANSRPEDLLFMDIETCGLAGATIFLLGTMFFDGKDLVFEQHLARDYSEEPAILNAFAMRCQRAGLLVTFNGKSFDMNQIRERCVFHNIDAFEGQKLPHLDLLPESRKRWRKLLPNCKLQTLEQHFCKRRRVGDIPGWAIPDAYHKFVSTADARQVRDIVHHNMLDLLTMAELLCAALTSRVPTADA